MYCRLRRALICLLLASACGEAWATEVRVERIASTSQGFLFLEFEFAEPFEGIFLEALRSGLPTTLHFTFEVWRQRTGWWDRLERTDEREFRIVRDVLNDEYIVISEEDTQVFSTLEDLTAAACVYRRGSIQGAIPLPFPSRNLSLLKTYYVVVTANVAPLSVEDLNELDDWLEGTIRNRGDSARGSISALSRTMGGLLMTMTGFGDKTVHSRTPYFKPVEVLVAPIVLIAPGAAEAGEDVGPAPPDDR